MDTLWLLAKSLLTMTALLYLAVMIWLIYWLRKCDRCSHQCNDGRGCDRQPLEFHHGISEVGSIRLCHKE